MNRSKRIVYALKNADNPPRFYTLLPPTCARLEAHNAGRCAHTAKYRPWVADVIGTFADEARAVAFEKYLKSGSGCEFARRVLR
jgi:putative endonuclease